MIFACDADLIVSDFQVRLSVHLPSFNQPQINKYYLLSGIEPHIWYILFSGYFANILFIYSKLLSSSYLNQFLSAILSLP